MSENSLPFASPYGQIDPSRSTNSIPFPTPTTETLPVIPDSSESSSSNLTSSDKLSALPGIQSSPALGRLYGSRTPRRSFEAATSLPTIQSSPALNPPTRLPTPASRYSESDGSAHGRETPRQRVSFDSDREALPTAVQKLKQAITRNASQQQESGALSPSIRSGESSQAGSRPRPQANPSPLKDGAGTPASRSPTQSRAASPLRFFGLNIHRTHSRDEPFIAVDPYRSHFRFFSSPTSSPSRPPLEFLEAECGDACTCCLPLPSPCNGSSKSRFRSCGSGLRNFFADTLPRQVYLQMLFRLPSLYFSRVARIFEDAELSKHEVQRMIEACAPAVAEDAATRPSIGIGMSTVPSGASVPRGAAIRANDTVFPFPDNWNPPSVSPAISRFKQSWEVFVDALIREWKTLNLVSVLLCTALLTMFQIPDAAGDPLTRWTALFSLICAIMSLTYGCVYIVQFGSMRTMYKASRWAEEAQKSKTIIWWNIWVLLAMPAIWLTWSMLSFCLAILSYVWRTGSSNDPSDGTRAPLTTGQAIIVRTVLTAVFGLGVVYFIMILKTFASYGEREVGWRRSWLKSGSFGHAERARERQRQAQERERERERGRRRARDSAPDRATGADTSAAGLGLTGLSANANLANISDSDFDKEKRKVDVYAVELERFKGRVSPKL